MARGAVKLMLPPVLRVWSRPGNTVAPSDQAGAAPNRSSAEISRNRLNPWPRRRPGELRQLLAQVDMVILSINFYKLIEQKI